MRGRSGLAAPANPDLAAHYWADSRETALRVAMSREAPREGLGGRCPQAHRLNDQGMASLRRATFQISPQARQRQYVASSMVLAVVFRSVDLQAGHAAGTTNLSDETVCCMVHLS